MGYTGKIEAREDKYMFELNGQQLMAGATYNANNGIRVYMPGVTSYGLNGLLAHEIQHAKWNDVVRKMDSQTYTRIGPLLDDPKAREELKATDGVTAYSKMYWDAVAKGERPFTNAVNETLAEMANNQMRYGFT